MMMGYTGKIAYVDLDKEKISYEYLDEHAARKYIGGTGLAAKILWDETIPGTEPLSSENCLIFMTGPLTGTIIPSASRYIVAGISPLTGIWGQAHSGGNWAYELRHAGFDGIVVKGKSGRPIYLWLHDGKVEIRNAEHLWSKDTYEVAELVKKETDNNASTACIGPAGEKLVRISCIMNDGRMGRAAARCGLGALMGSKRLKAVVVRGTLPVGYYDEQKLRESIKRIYNLYPIRKAADVIEGHIASLKKRLEIGGAPVKNWSRGTFESGYKLADECRKQSHCAVKVVPLTIWSRFSLRMEKDAWCMRHGDH